MPRGNKGNKRIPANCYLKLIAFIKTKEGNEFTSNELVSMTGIKRGTVNSFLLRRFLRNELLRFKKGKSYFYKQIKSDIRISASKGQVADGVWIAFHKKEKIFIKELHQTVKDLMDETENFSIRTIYKTISFLFLRGYIEKSKKPFGNKWYSLKKEYWNTERPLIIN
ncbi:MAG: hypothetical protein ABIF22_00380 [bacterium]